MTYSRKAHRAGQGTSTSDKADGANVGRVGERVKNESPNSRGTPSAEQALEVIEGEGYALAYLQRLQADMAQPGELAVLVTFLTGEMLHAACRVIERALGGRHG